MTTPFVDPLALADLVTTAFSSVVSAAKSFNFLGDSCSVIAVYLYAKSFHAYSPGFAVSLIFPFLDVFSMFTHIWEHLGNWFHENPNKRNKYRVESLERIDEYKKIGFFAERNLQLSFGSNENEFDVQSINRKVAMFAVPPPSPETIAILSRR